MTTLSLDVAIVGGGFAGCLSLHEFRQRGFNAKVFETGDDIGGVWYWNRYPGVQVDSLTPYYQFTHENLWKDFDFDKKYASGKDMRGYFAYLEKKLQLKKDIMFQQRVLSAQYCADDERWHLETDKGVKVTSRFVVWAVGTTNKKLLPQWKGLNSFKGQVIHPAAWPEDFDATGKKIAVVGQGSTGIQIVEELAKKDCDLTVFVRTPPIAMPQRQQTYAKAEIDESKKSYPEAFEDLQTAGKPFAPPPDSFHDATPEERKEKWEKSWKQGGLTIMTGNYYDVGTDETANRAMYDFWASKVRPRMKNDAKREIMASLEPKSWLGAKRSCVETDYYEMLDRDNVHIVDLLATPMQQVTESGLVTNDNKLREFDVLVLATGYDSVTGSLHDAHIRDRHGRLLQEKWKDGVRTHLGMMVPDMPNAFILYGPQAPTSLANGPTFIELQVNWVMDMVENMAADKVASVEPKTQSAEQWNATNVGLFNMTLVSKQDSWWNGANVPGKKREPLLWFGGQTAWKKEAEKALQDWSQWEVKPTAGTGPTGTTENL